MIQVFKTTDYTIRQLVDDIDIGDIALPDIQRPFVWSNKLHKIRDLFDSLYKGYPIGYLVFWENADRKDYKNIGLDVKKRQIPRFLVIDGQQRLTALYSVMKNSEIITPDYKKKKIKIAFRPIDGTFMVGGGITDRDPEFIPDISILWSDIGDYLNITNFINRLKNRRSITQDEEKIISSNIQRLINIGNYQLTALEISADIDEETVSDIFVRINSQGVNLTQTDFILTLLSVYWEEGREKIEKFCMDTRNFPDNEIKYSSFNHIIKPDPKDMLRVLVGYSFKRAKMRDVYSLIRGRDFDANDYNYSEKLRNQRFGILKNKLSEILDNTNWHSFLKILIGAGYKDQELISSRSAVIYSYVVFLISKYELNIDIQELQKIIAKWYIMSSLTGRYSTSPESSFEKDLNRIKGLSKSNFIQTLEKIINENLTNDFWNITLVSQMDTSSSNGPEANAFYAALNKLGVNVLFSNKQVRDLYDPNLKIARKYLEKHHIFPRNYLKKRYGYDSVKDKSKINQIANLTFVEFENNLEISDMAPSDYIKIFQNRFTQDQLRNMLEAHGIPENFYLMEYEDFLFERRRRMSQIIRAAFESL